MKTNKRVFLTVKDVMELTGKSQRTCYGLLRFIRIRENKPPKAPITIEEFSRFTGLTIETVQKNMTV